MWYHQKDPILLSIVVYDNVLLLILAQKVHTRQYVILSHTLFKSNVYELKDGIIYNFTTITRFIVAFLKKQNIRPSFLVIILDNQQVVTHFFTSVQPFSDGLLATKLTHKQANHMHYIGPFQDTDHLLHNCTVLQNALLQYELLASLLNIPLLCITCWMHPLLYAYRGCKKTAFRSSELTKDMMQNNISFVNFFTQDMMNRLLYQVPIVDFMHKKAFLMTYGHLFYQETLHG
jgi:hypothetical protein